MNESSCRPVGTTATPFLHGSSERLRFAAMVPAHALPLSAALLDPAVYAYIESGPPKSTGQFAAQIERWMAGPQQTGSTDRWINVAVFSLEGDAGLGRLEATLVGCRAEIAYLFGREYWGKGYAFEALLWFQDQLLQAGVTEFWATVRPDNERSVRILRRLNFTPVEEGWPDLGSYDPGDLVFCHSPRMLPS